MAPAVKKSGAILFSGNGIKLIELKKEIAEKKKFSNNLDYDLTVTDENGKVIIVLCKSMYVCMYVGM